MKWTPGAQDVGTYTFRVNALDEYGLEQPTLDRPGSTSPITELSGYPFQVAKGKRLFFDAEEVYLWDNLVQPVLHIGGSQSPDTPLEGHARVIEAGMRLNFEYYPIREVVSLRLDDLRIGDLLGF